MTMYADKPLRCVTCGADFVFTAAEQQFHAAKGFTNEPRRCVACRQARRGARVSSARAVAPSDTADRTQPAPSEPQPVPSDQPPTPAAGDSDRKSFTATCSACGGEAILPFEPMGNRPVLCSACYDKIKTFA